MTLVASRAATATPANPSISGDGNEVAFSSAATNFAAADVDTLEDVYVRPFPDILALVSRATGTTGAKGNQPSAQPAINDDGGPSCSPAAATTSPRPTRTQAADVFMRTARSNTSPDHRPSQPAATLAERMPTAPSISRPVGNNTRLTAFQTAADNMGADDDDDFTQVYARRRASCSAPNAAPTSRARAAPAAFRSGVNSSHLRPQQRAGENAVAINQDGRFTVFLSDADELSSEDDDRFFNVFRRDNLTGETTLVSRAAAPRAPRRRHLRRGGPRAGAAAPRRTAISADGNRIAFITAATNLAGDDANGLPDVFVRDVAAATTVLASRQPNGAPVPLASPGDPAMSGDGNRVAFSTASSMDAQDAGNADVYLRDLAAGTTALVSRRARRPGRRRRSSAPALDADGSHVAFRLLGDRPRPAVRRRQPGVDVFVRDVAAGQVRLVSRAAAGMATANDGSSVPAISADGNRIAFASGATNLGGGSDVNGGVHDVFLRDMAAAPRRSSAAPPGPTASPATGRPSARRSTRRAPGSRSRRWRPTSCPDDVNGLGDVLVRDMAAATTELVSRGACRRRAGKLQRHAEPITGNGDCVIFETYHRHSRRTRPAPTTSAWPRARCAATARSARWRRRPAGRPRAPTPHCPSCRGSASRRAASSRAGA